MKILHLLMSIIILGFFSCKKETVYELDTSQLLQKVLDDNLEQFNGVGVSASIVFQNQDTWSGTCGISHGNTELSDDMVLGTGSVTKTYIAALCLQLSEEGIFNLEDSLHKWLPEYPNIDSTITIQQLLYNTSGIYNITDNPELWNAVFDNPDKSWTPEEIIGSYLEEPYASPGEGWFYSNTNYILLGQIINKATGHSISEELNRSFFDPLGLNKTFLDVEETILPNIAHGWFDISGDGKYDDISLISRTGINSVLWTSGAIFSNASDLANWLSALMNGNAISQSALEKMLTSCCETGSVGLGMGIFIIDPNNSTGTELIGYTGRTFGYLTSAFYLPDYGISVVVIINEDNTEFLDVITTELILEAVKH